MHSFTEIPEDLSKAHVFDRKDDSINNGRFEYAQFAFCFSFSGTDALLLEKLCLLTISLLGRSKFPGHVDRSYEYSVASNRLCE